MTFILKIKYMLIKISSTASGKSEVEDTQSRPLFHFSKEEECALFSSDKLRILLDFRPNWEHNYITETNTEPRKKSNERRKNTEKGI